MNRILPESVVRSVCRELLAQGSAVSGRRLTRELRTRFGAVGRAERVFRIWREEMVARQTRHAAPPPLMLPTDVLELQQRLHIAEAQALETKARAERAELREEAHQSHWALEIDQLRQRLAAQPAYATEVMHLKSQVARLTAELAAARAVLAERI
jgi:hypothetical protein